VRLPGDALLRPGDAIFANEESASMALVHIVIAADEADRSTTRMRLIRSGEIRHKCQAVRHPPSKRDGHGWRALEDDLCEAARD